MSLKAMKMPITVEPQVQKGPERPLSQQKKEPPKAPPKENPQDVEKQMMDFLQQKEFTRALYLFRSLERSGCEQQLKSEELLSNFVVSAIRVEKFDVVERMLRVAKRNGIELTLKSWKAMLKML